MGDGVTLVSSADETAREVYRVLTERTCSGREDAPAPRARVPQHRRSGAVRPAGAAIPRARGGRDPASVTPSCRVAAERRRSGRAGRCRRPRETHGPRLRRAAFPVPDSACSAYLIEADGFRLMLDFGTGSLSALQRYSGLKSVDAVAAVASALRSHAGRLLVRRRPPVRAGRSVPRLPLFAPAGARERMIAAYGSPTRAHSTTSTRSSRCSPARSRSGRFGDRGPGRASGRDVRCPDRARRPYARVLGRHGAVRRR